MNRTSRVLDQLFAHWRQQGLTPRPPCTPSEIEAFEEHEAVALPEDFRIYWGLADGMREEIGRSQDSEGFSFWPLHRVMRADRELERKSPHTPSPTDSSAYYVFADYLDWSWAYAIKLRSAESGKVVIVGAKA